MLATITRLFRYGHCCCPPSLTSGRRRSLLLPHTGLLLAVIMFAMGLTLTLDDFKRVLSRPAPVLAGLGLHYLVMPLAAWALARLFQMPPQLAIGMILVGSVASGTASNVIIYLSRGDVALSVTISSLSTLVGVVATPLLTRLYVDAAIKVEVAAMLLSILQIVILPIGLGLLAHRFFAPQVRRLEPLLPLLSMLAIVALIAAIVAGSKNHIATVGGLTILAVMLHNAIGLLGGYWEDACWASTNRYAARWRSRWACRTPAWPPSWARPTSARWRPCPARCSRSGTIFPARSWPAIGGQANRT